MKKYTVWTNDVNPEDLRTELEEIYGKLSDEQLYELTSTHINACLQDEKANLKDIVADEGLIILADLGLWYGRVSAYREVESGKVVDCFDITCGDNTEWYVDVYGNLRCTDAHHDGTNHYVVRAWKKGLSEKQKTHLRDAAVSGNVTPTMYGRYTDAIGWEIANIYGWKVRCKKGAAV